MAWLRLAAFFAVDRQIAKLSNALDSDRLQVLKEVAGTKVYDDRRAETLKIVDETEQKRNQISEMLADIDKRLAELEEEKAELDRYQALDQDRRMLEHCIYNKELADATEKLRDVRRGPAPPVRAQCIPADA